MFGTSCSSARSANLTFIKAFSTLISWVSLLLPVTTKAVAVGSRPPWQTLSMQIASTCSRCTRGRCCARFVWFRARPSKGFLARFFNYESTLGWKLCVLGASVRSLAQWASCVTPLTAATEIAKQLHSNLWSTWFASVRDRLFTTLFDLVLGWACSGPS